MTLPARIAKYEIRRELGIGAMGTVYEGFDPVIERRVAIKTIGVQYLSDSADSAVARFKREAQAAGRLQHPSIVAVYEYGEEAGLAFIVMEYLEGQTLREMLRAHGRPALIDTYGLVRQLLMALDYSHRQGVVHRDIKPANLMVVQPLKLKVMDFGIAHVDSSSMTQTGSVLGTPTHMAPEQLKGLQVDGRADLWSTGVILYELLTGHTPFAAESTAAVMHHVLQGDPPLPSTLDAQIGPAFDAVVARSLAKEPAHRFQTAAEFSSALLAAFRGKPAREAVPPAPPEAERTLSPEQTARYERTGTVGTGRAIALNRSLGPETLARIEASLTRAIGPIAHQLIRQSAEQSNDVDEFYARLSASIPPGGERDAFDAHMRRLENGRSTRPPAHASTAAPHHAPPHAPVAAPHAKPRPPQAVDAALLAKAEQELARRIGPLARLLVKRAAAPGVDAATLLQRLAEQIDEPAERKAFLDAMR